MEEENLTEIERQIEFFRGINLRNWAEKVENRIMELETQKIVAAERINLANPKNFNSLR